MYKQWRPQATSRRKKLQKQRFKRRLKQWAVCLCLFLLTFQMFLPKNYLLSQSTPDLETAFRNLGNALSTQTFTFQKIEDFCVEVFAIQTSPEEDDAVMVFLPQEEAPLFSSSTEEEDSHLIKGQEIPNLQAPFPYPEQGQVVIALQQPEKEEESMAIGTVLASFEEDGEDYTFDFLYLGEAENFPPIYSVVTSEFGTRLHPISNIYTLHRGVDLRANIGTEIHAWRSGTVIEVGENSSMGIFIRLDHGDNIQSLYGHCSEILLNQGDAIEGGSIIALSGDSGNVTAPHLHFEILWNEENLNPLHYFDYESILS